MAQSSITRDLAERIATARISVVSHKLSLAGAPDRLAFFDAEIAKLQAKRADLVAYLAKGPGLLTQAEQELASLTHRATYDPRVNGGLPRSRGLQALEARALALEAQLQVLTEQLEKARAKDQAR